jgi:hypothetical protein
MLIQPNKVDFSLKGKRTQIHPPYNEMFKKVAYEDGSSRNSQEYKLKSFSDSIWITHRSKIMKLTSSSTYRDCNAIV